MIKGARILRFNAFQSNCVVIWDNQGKSVIFDPGFFEDEEREQLYSLIKEEKLEPEAILLTHSHFDHIYGVTRLQKDLGIPVYMDPADKYILEVQNEQVRAINLEVPDTTFTTTDVKDGDIITVGELSFKAISTPGHTPGGVCWYDEEDKVIISGDTLFAGCIGRTDLPGGDYEALITSILTKLMRLDGDIDVLPGHGRYTTIADERQKNPFLQPFNEPYEEEEKEDER